MKATPLLDKARTEIKLGEYRVASATALNDPTYLSRVQEYRRLASARMFPLDKEDIRLKVPKADYFVSRKVDGEFTVLIWDGTDVVTLNPGGTVRTGLPVTQEAASLLSKSGLKHAMVAGELYVEEAGRRSRVHDIVTVARQPGSEADLRRIHFAVFDILPMEGAAPTPYAETWKNIERIFGKGQRITPVETQKANGPDQVEKWFDKWVTQEDAEGIVARSETGGTFKIKPRYSLDVAVIGFTESVGEREGMMHDLLYAVMRKDGTFQVLSRVGGGFNEDERRTMLSDLKDMIVESEYAEVNSDHVAYQMVRPDWVIELSCLDLISQTTRGGPVNRVVLDYKKDGPGKYHVLRRMPLATVISPQFVRRREDKSAKYSDIKIEQVSSVVEVASWDRDARSMTMPTSEVLRRDVYTKVLKGETMVRKFLMLKTNKETESDEYPAYVLHFTDFSPSRKTPLDREVRVSSSLEQMQQLWKEMVDENVKKGWDLESSSKGDAKPASTAVTALSTTTPVAPVETAPVEEKGELAPKKSAKKKAPAKAEEETVKTEEPAKTEEVKPKTTRKKKGT